MEDDDKKLKDLKKQREEAKKRKGVIGTMFNAQHDNEIEELEKES